MCSEHAFLHGLQERSCSCLPALRDRLRILQQAHALLQSPLSLPPWQLLYNAPHNPHSSCTLSSVGVLAADAAAQMRQLLRAGCCLDLPSSCWTGNTGMGHMIGNTNAPWRFGCHFAR